MNPDESAEATPPPEPQPQPLATIANAALLACVAMVLVSALPFYRSFMQLLNLAGTQPNGLAMASLFLGLLFSLALPVFFLALFRGAATLRFREDFRLPALFIAVLWAILGIASIGLWIARVFGNSDSTVLTAAPNPFHLDNLVTLAIGLLNLLPVGVLYALYRQPNPESIAPPYQPLRIICTVTVVIAVLWLGFLTIRIAAFPFLYQTIRDQSQRLGRGAPTLIGLMADGFHTLVEQACTYAAPVLVWLSLRVQPAPPGDTTPASAPPDTAEDVSSPGAATLES